MFLVEKYQHDFGSEASLFSWVGKSWWLFAWCLVNRSVDFGP